jgi:hypothetical protein
MKTPIAKSKTSKKAPKTTSAVGKSKPAAAAQVAPAEGQTWKHNKTGQLIVLGNCSAKQCTARSALSDNFNRLIRFTTLTRDYSLAKAAPKRAAKK